MTIDFRFVSRRTVPSPLFTNYRSLVPHTDRLCLYSLVHPTPNQISKPHLSGYCAILVEDVLTIENFCYCCFCYVDEEPVDIVLHLEQSGFALFLDDGSSRANSIILFRSFDSDPENHF